MKEVISKGRVLARHIAVTEIMNGLNFFSQDPEFIQIGTWQYQSGKILEAHIHNEFTRNITRTCEAFIVMNGKLEVAILNLNEVYVDTVVLEKGDILILLECGHAVRILQDDTLVIEVKNGPFMGVDIDKRKFDYNWGGG